ncbi:hypothetical protein H9P43_005176 [Blastocladiella emersonii ATCC 22665]|nr:hypothetical protein H9P43_005176 [Blastocladiella emersonii ATCC 22665]
MLAPWLIPLDTIVEGNSAVLNGNTPMFLAIHCAAIAVNLASVASSFLVALHVLGFARIPQWILPTAGVSVVPRHGLMHHDISTRLSFYLAVASMVFSGWHTLDHLYLVAYQRIPPRSISVPLGIVQGVSFGYQQLLSFCASAYTYVLVCRGKRIPLGRYDWKLHFYCLLNIAVCLAITVSLDGYGFSGYYCLWNIHSPGGAVSLCFGVALSLVNALSTIIGLAHVRRAVRAAAATIQKPRQFESARLQVASRCLVGMINVAAFLHMPRAATLVLVAGFHLAGYLEPVSILFVSLSANSAGLADALVYLHNQRIKAQAAVYGAGRSTGVLGNTTAQLPLNEGQSTTDSNFWND